MTEAIIILGMHRSGTSCLTGTLKSHGLALGEVSDYNKYNKKGNQENKAVFRLNEALLQHNGGAWHTPPAGPLHSNPELETRRTEVLADYQSLPKPWGIKDPRMLLTYDFWQDHLPAHAFIGTFRHPLAVAQSLAARERLSIPLEQGLALWATYNEKLLELQQQHRFAVVNFDWAPARYQAAVEQLAETLGLGPQAEQTFFDAKLVSQQPPGLAECPAELLPLYRELMALAGD